MLIALAEAAEAPAHGDAPVGAVVVHESEIISAAHNRVASLSDPSAHAEAIAIRLAAQRLRNWRLSSCTLYVTLEPCAMCAGLIRLSRISRLVFGAPDASLGACGSHLDLLADPAYGPPIPTRGGVLASDCALALCRAFEERRGKTAKHTSPSLPPSD